MEFKTGQRAGTPAAWANIAERLEKGDIDVKRAKQFLRKYPLMEQNSPENYEALMAIAGEKKGSKPKKAKKTLAEEINVPQDRVDAALGISKEQSTGRVGKKKKRKKDNGPKPTREELFGTTMGYGMVIMPRGSTDPDDQEFLEGQLDDDLSMMDLRDRYRRLKDEDVNSYQVKYFKFVTKSRNGKDAQEIGEGFFRDAMDRIGQEV